MKEQTIQATIKVCTPEELSPADRRLADAAYEATLRSYSPYSHFSVGAAALLEDGTIVSGSNQENVAYPSGICAERTTLFYANSRHPGTAVTAIAIAARDGQGTLLPRPTPPCGACRQVMMETELRYKCPMHILLCGTQEVFIIEGVSTLLPLSFDETSMKQLYYSLPAQT